MRRSFQSTVKGALSLVIATAMCATGIPATAFAGTSQATIESAASAAGSESGSSGERFPVPAEALDRTSMASGDPSATDRASAADALPGWDGDDAMHAPQPASDADHPSSAVDGAQSPLVASEPVIECVPSPTGATVDVRASGSAFDIASKVRFAVWSDAGGQDDIVWYGGTRLDGGVWGLAIPVSNHRSFGDYSVHAYESAPANRFIAATSFALDAPAADIAITQTTAQVQSGDFTVTISGIDEPEAIKAFRVPIWSEANGQDDLVWYEPAKVGDDEWQVVASCVSGKRSAGKYFAHLYVIGQSGIFAFVNEAAADVDAADSVIKATLSSDETKATLEFEGPSAIKSSRVQIPVWSEQGGQDDIVWYEGARRGDGSWEAVVDIRRHATAGSYFAHAYSTGQTGTGFAGLAEFEVTPVAASVDVTGTENGRYEVVIAIGESPAGISRVQVPTWTKAGGQDDIVWHPASRDDDGTWSCVITAGEHNGEEGEYISHAYVTAGNGITSFVGSCAATIACRDYAYVTGAIGSGFRNVCIKAPLSDDIQIAVWSKEGAQDDIRWYPTVHRGQGVYAANVDCRSLKHPNAAIAHIYVAGKHVATVDFWVSAEDLVPPEYRAMHDRIMGTASSTGYLIAVDTSRCVVGVFSGSQGNWVLARAFACAPGKPSTPTVKGYFTVTGKGYVFGNGYSCYYWTQFYGNYLFHSILYNPGTFVVQDPTMGRQVSHGCVRLELDNAKWIHDSIPYGTRVVVY